MFGPFAVLFVNLVLRRLADPITPGICSASTQAELLGSQIGVTVRVSRDIAGQPTLVVPNGAKPRQLLEGLAYALHATIMREGSGLRIMRTKHDRDALELIDQRLVAEGVRSSLNEWKADLKGMNPVAGIANRVSNAIHADAGVISTAPSVPGVARQRGMDPGLLSPAGRLLQSLIDHIGVDNIASVPPMGIRVYSNVPTSMEQGVSDVDGLLSQFAREQSLFAKDFSPRLSNFEKKIASFSLLLPDPTESLQGLKFLLTVRRYRSDLASVRSDLGITLSVSNAKGHTVAFARFTTGPRDNGSPVPRSALAKRQSPTSLIDLNPEQVSYESCLSYPAVPIPDKSPLWNILRQPEINDPANILLLSALDAGLHSDAKPAIAVITDDMILATHYAVQDKYLNVAAFNSIMLDSCESLTHGGVSIIRPVNPAASDLLFCDRLILGSEIRRFLKIKEIDIRGWSNLAFQLGDSLGYFAQQMTDVVRNGATLPTFLSKGTCADEVFAILGSMSADQWDALENGGSTRLQGEAFRQKLWTYLLRYGMDSGPQSYREVQRDACEVFPNGIPAEIEMTVRLTPVLMLRAATDPGKPSSTAIELRTWVKLVHRILDTHGADPAKDEGLQTRRRLLGYGTAALDKLLEEGFLIPMIQSTIQAVVELPNGEKIDWDLPCFRREVAGKSKFADLPKEYRDAVYDEWMKLEPKNPNF